MTAFSKWKTIGYAVAIFASGAVSGGALGVYTARRAPRPPPGGHEFVGRMRQRLQAQLALTPEQMSKIDPIIQNTATQVRAIHLDAMQRMEKVLDDSIAQVSPLLDAGQKEKLDQMRKRHERMERMERMGEGPLRHGGGEGAP